jgi:hypothetical protein
MIYEKGMNKQNKQTNKLVTPLSMISDIEQTLEMIRIVPRSTIKIFHPFFD